MRDTRVGGASGFLGGSTTFLAGYNTAIFPYGVFAIPLYILTVGYGIFRHQLMDIKVVIRKTLVYSTVSASLAAVYVSIVLFFVHIVQLTIPSATLVSSIVA